MYCLCQFIRSKTIFRSLQNIPNLTELEFTFGNLMVKRLLSWCHITKIRTQHNIAAENNTNANISAEHYEEIEKEKSADTKLGDMIENFCKSFNGSAIMKEMLNGIENVMSIVVSSQELSCVTMNRHRQLCDLINIPFPKTNRSSRLVYYGLLHPLLQFQPHIDLNIIELVTLPPKYDSINLHLKSVSMMLIGMLEKDLKNPRVVLACRKKMGKIFDLNVEKTVSRKCSKSVVTEIVTQQKWNDSTVQVPERLLLKREDTIYYAERLKHKLPNSAISPETADAFLQALGFWEFVKETRSK